jgi:hypothetical protein
MSKVGLETRYLINDERRSEGEVLLRYLLEFVLFFTILIFNFALSFPRSLNPKKHRFTVVYGSC